MKNAELFNIWNFHKDVIGRRKPRSSALDQSRSVQFLKRTGNTDSAAPQLLSQRANRKNDKHETTFIYPEIFLRERGTVEQQRISHFCSLAQVKFQKEAWVWEKRRQRSLRGKIF